jgi:hypothetical protein
MASVAPETDKIDTRGSTSRRVITIRLSGLFIKRSVTPTSASAHTKAAGCTFAGSKKVLAHGLLFFVAVELHFRGGEELLFPGLNVYMDTSRETGRGSKN